MIKTEKYDIMKTLQLIKKANEELSYNFKEKIVIFNPENKKFKTTNLLEIFIMEDNQLKSKIRLFGSWKEILNKVKEIQ